MRACGFVGSPIKGGNVDLLVSQVLAGAASQGVEASKWYLNDMDIRPCQSCGSDPYPRYCRFEDDMAEIYRAVDNSELIVLGSPVYFDTVTAQTKLAIDRCNCLMPYVQAPDGTFRFVRRILGRKKGVLIAVAGRGQGFGTIATTVEGFFHWANAEMAETILYAHDGNHRGGVAQDNELMARAYNVGAELAAQMRAPLAGAGE